MEQLMTIAVCLVLSLVLTELFRKLNLPEVVGQISAGIILGLPFMGFIFPQGSVEHIRFLSELGIVFLLLLVGLEVNIKRLEKLSKIEFLIAIFSAVLPFLIGYFMMQYLGFNTIISLVVGASLSITAEGTTLKVLMDAGQLNTKLGTIILGAGIIDDVLEILLLAVVLIFAHNPVYNPEVAAKTVLFFPLMVVGFMTVCLILLKFAPKIVRYFERENSRVTTFSLVMVMGVGIAAISQLFGLGPIIGAFFAGVLIHWVNQGKKEEVDVVEELKIMTFAFIVPFFFINIGLHFDISTLFDHTGLVLLVLTIAVAGKLLGTMFVHFFTKELSMKQSVLIGWGMNSRGAIELVIAEVARANGLIPDFIYSSIVIMAVLTTLIFPMMLKYYLKSDPKIMKR